MNGAQTQVRTDQNALQADRGRLTNDESGAGAVAPYETAEPDPTTGVLSSVCQFFPTGSHCRPPTRSEVAAYAAEQKRLPSDQRRIASDERRLSTDQFKLQVAQDQLKKDEGG